jgi:peptidoglycan/LPS O-acetylase OafA/YrhL
VGHIWSLSTEEQFYLLWPPIMMWVSRKAARRILFTTVFAGPLFRIAARVLVTKISPSHPYLPLYTTGFFARPEPIAAGCLMALLAVDQDSLGNLNRWFTWRPAIFAAMIAVACIALASHVKVFAIVCRPTISALTIPIMLWACANARGWAARALAWRPAVALGVLSYSIYLWQQPFLSQEDPDSRFTRFPIGIGLALAAAIVSYLVVERPFLKLKDRAAVARRNAVPDAL